MQAPAPTVYLVDDDPDLLKALQRLLQSAGLQATPFDSAQAFLDGHDRAAPGPIRLFLLDDQQHANRTFGSNLRSCLQ